MNRLAGTAQAVTLAPAWVIAVVYLGFGLWALVISDYDPFWSVFLVPGALLLAVCAAPRT